jgi:hypothetical protein
LELRRSPDFLLKLRAGISASASRGNKKAELQSIKLDPQWRALLLETAWRRSGFLREKLADMTTPRAAGLVKNEFTPFLREHAEGGALADLVGDTAAEVMLARLAALDKAGPPQFLLAAAEPFPAAVVLSYPGIPREAGGLVEGNRNVAFPSESDRFHLVRRLAPERNVIFFEAYYIVERLGEENAET